MGRKETAYQSFSGPPPFIDAAIERLATRQGGVIAIEQLRRLGLGVGAVKHRIRTGRLIRLHHGVYAVGHRSLGPRGRRWAAVLACGPHAVLSHRSAAAAWGFRPSDRIRMDVTTAARGRAGPKGVDVHRVRHLDPQDRTELDGLPITTVARTLVDLADVLDHRSLDRAIHEAEVLRLLDLTAIIAALQRANGRRGTANLAPLIARRTARPATRSELERRFLELCATAGVPQPQTNVRVASYEVDALWPSHQLIAELDGRATHDTDRGFETDRRRDADLLVAGYRIVRFTWRRLHTEPDRVQATLKALLGPRVPGRAKESSESSTVRPRRGVV